MSTREQPWRVRYPLGVAGLVLVAFLLRAGVDRFVNTLATGSTSGLPMFGTVGQTVVVYNSGVVLFTFVLVPAAAFWLGKRYGQASA